MIQLQQYAQGAILPVRAQAAARGNGVLGEHDGALRVSVTQAPEKGQANKAIIAVLAKQLGFSKSRIQLIGGEKSARKRFAIAGVSVEELQARIDELLA